MRESLSLGSIEEMQARVFWEIRGSVVEGLWAKAEWTRPGPLRRNVYRGLN